MHATRSHKLQKQGYANRKIIYKQLTACYHDYAKQDAGPRHMLQPQAHQVTSSRTVQRVNTVHLDTH
jgi:hypothetical protein